MTELFITSDNCKCIPNRDDTEKVLIITEGHTCVWGCKHVKAQEKKYITKYVEKI